MAITGKKAHSISETREVTELIGMYMDESDWKFVIDCLQYRARTSPASSDTAERAEFTADTIQDVLDSLRNN